MNNEIVLSIVIPIYNVDKFLNECIDSIVSQEMDGVELVLVDDGSTDKSGEICDFYASNNKKIKVIHKANGGLVSARKAGAQVAIGDYIACVDGDDAVCGNYLSVLKDIIREKVYDVICFNYFTWIDGNLYENKMSQVGCYDRGMLENDVFANLLSNKKREFFSFGIVPSIWSKVIRRDLLVPIQKSVPNEISLGEDACVTYRAMLDSNAIYFEKECLYKYRQNQASITNNYRKNNYDSLVSLTEYFKVNMMFPKYNIDDQIIDYIVYMFISNMNCLTNAKSTNFKFIYAEIKKYINNEDFRLYIRQFRSGPAKWTTKLNIFLAKHKLTFFMSLEICLKLKLKKSIKKRK